MVATRYTLPLNKTRLLFLDAQVNGPTTQPNISDRTGTVVQVTIKSRSPSPSKKDLAIFAIEQQDITTAIETLLLVYLNRPDKLTRQVVIREDKLLGYTLIGERKKWIYGQRKQFYWGMHPLRSSEDNQMFATRHLYQSLYMRHRDVLPQECKHDVEIIFLENPLGRR